MGDVGTKVVFNSGFNKDVYEILEIENEDGKVRIAEKGPFYSPREFDRVEDPAPAPRFTQFSKEMSEKYGGAGWMLSSTKAEYAKYKDLEHNIPVEIREIYQKKYGDQPIVLKLKDRDMGVMFTPSSKEPGLYTGHVF